MFSLADAILKEDSEAIKQLLRYEGVDNLDEYGFRPLIEAAIVDNIEITRFLLSQGADPNLQDLRGGTALQWAAENNNVSLAQLLLNKGANPNAYNFSGQPVLVMPMLRRQKEMKKLLIEHGGDEKFAQDYINTKMIGHLFELVGIAEILSPEKEFVDVDFEGFILEVTLGLIANSLGQFQNHYAARQLRRYSGLVFYIVEILERALTLIRFQQYRVSLTKHKDLIHNIFDQEPLVIPIGYEGHAIAYIKYQDIWVKCDRREDSRLYDNVMFYRIGNLANANHELLAHLLYTKQTETFINKELDQILGLQPITELKVEAQISGNCSWANIEACVPALFFLILMQMNQDQKDVGYFKSLALNFYHRWRDWNKARALDYCLARYQESNLMRKAGLAEILAAILFQSCDPKNLADRDRIDKILKCLLNSPYRYILDNYLRVYYYESYTEEGKNFAELLKLYDYPK